MRTFSGDTLVVASHNPGKVREIRDLLAPFGIKTRSAAELGLPEPEETGQTFAENAAIKAQAAATASGMPGLADDSGLEVAALGGAPGIFSARWAGPGKDFTIAMQRIETELQALRADGEVSRRARFVCALCLAWPDGHTQAFEGTVEGDLVWPPRGGKGFGYDPIFVADGESETFGEMEPARKHAMSHRARAFEKLIDACFSDR